MIRWFLLIIMMLSLACGSPRKGAFFRNRDTTARRKQVVHPPQSFIDAVFNYKKQYSLWPPSLQEVTSASNVRNDYKQFIDGGMERIQISEFSKDSLLIDFYYSRRKENALYGDRDKRPHLRDIQGKYIFISDGTLVLFKVELHKPKLFEAGVK